MRRGPADRGKQRTAVTNWGIVVLTQLLVPCLLCGCLPRYTKTTVTRLPEPEVIEEQFLQPSVSVVDDTSEGLTLRVQLERITTTKVYELSEVAKEEKVNEVAAIAGAIFVGVGVPFFFAAAGNEGELPPPLARMLHQ